MNLLKAGVINGQRQESSLVLPRFLTVILIVAMSFVSGCGANISVPAGTSVQYENHFEGATVSVGKPLSDRIIAKLNAEPDEADKGAAMGLDTRKYVHIENRTFQIMKNSLVLMDDWGVRSWSFKEIEADLDALVKKAPNKTNAPDQK